MFRVLNFLNVLSPKITFPFSFSQFPAPVRKNMAKKKKKAKFQEIDKMGLKEKVKP